MEITIDLKGEDFLEQSKLYNRIKSSLSSPEIEQFDFKLSWEPADSSVCSSSIAKFFNDCGYKVEQHGVQIHTSTTSDLKIPCKLFEHRQIDSDTAKELAEYFGTILLSCDINISKELSSYKPSLNLNLDKEDYVQAVILHCKGLLTADFLVKLLKLARISAGGKIIFSVNGFEHALLMGSNSYTISLVDDTKFILFKT